jgi:uncharacterized protein (TIGR02145 family)
MKRYQLFLILAIFSIPLFATSVFCQSLSIPSLRIYRKGDSSLYIPLQYIDSIVHYNIVSPTVITGSPQSVTRNSAYFSAKVNVGGGTVTKTGFCWSTVEEPTINSTFKYSGDFNGVNFTCELLGLLKNTKYYVRAFAINESGFSYGNQVDFITVNSSDVIVIDGDEYNTVTLGGKCGWGQLVLQENLKVSKYANGDTIRYVRNQEEMLDATNKLEGAYCYYNFDPSFDSVYGKLYNIYALRESRGLAPLGWKIPGFMDMPVVLYECGGADKSIGTIETKDGLWKEPNVGATNDSGFNGHPGGLVVGNEFKFLGEIGFWWIVDRNGDIQDFYALTHISNSFEYRSGSNYLNIYYGLDYQLVSFASVRCVKNP